MYNIYHVYDKIETIVECVTVNNQFLAVGENKTHFKLKPNISTSPLANPMHTHNTQLSRSVSQISLGLWKENNQ